LTDNATIALSILRGIPVLQDLDEQDLQALVKRARIKTFASEEVIYEEGEPCNSLWIILNGAVRLLTTAENDGHEIVTASLESGDFFGDEALQPGYEGRRTASAIATETTTLAKLARPDYCTIAHKIPPGQIFGLTGCDQGGGGIQQYHVTPGTFFGTQNLLCYFGVRCRVAACQVCDIGRFDSLATRAKQRFGFFLDLESLFEPGHFINKLLDALPGIEAASIFSYRTGVRPEEEWHAPNLQGEYHWDPMQVIEQTTIPVLAFFGELDTQIDPILSAQAYQEALERAGNPNYRVELIPDTDHNIVLSETGCLEERENRPHWQWTNYAENYLDILEDWLRQLRR